MIEKIEIAEFYKEKLKRVSTSLLSKEEELIIYLKDFFNKLNLKEENNYHNVGFEIMTPEFNDESYPIFCQIFDKDFYDINNDFSFSAITEPIEYDESEIGSENDFESPEFNKRYEKYYKSLNDIFFPWFAKCWQKAGGMEVKTPSFLNFYHVGGLGLDLITMLWSGDYELTERDVELFNVGILEEEDINQVAKIPIENELYKLYFENETMIGIESFEISLDNNKLLINNFEKGKQTLEFKYFDDALLEMNKIIIEKRKLGFKAKNINKIS